MRLKAIAHVRAQTMAAKISPKVFHPGQPRFSLAATTIEANANGKAKTVWDSLTKEAYLEIEVNIEHSTSNIQHRTGDRGLHIVIFSDFAPRSNFLFSEVRMLATKIRISS